MGFCRHSSALCLVVVASAFCLWAPANAALSAELEDQLKRAEALQEERPVDKPATLSVVSHIIALSPAAELANGDGDISTVGKSEH